MCEGATLVKLEARLDESALSFAYGNLACSTNHKPTREAFESLALGRGWTKEQFDAWADRKEWWKR